MTDPTLHARAAVQDLITAVENLAANLLPGSPRNWRAPRLSAEKRAQLDREAREERLHFEQQGDLPPHLRGLTVATPPGESPAPFDLDVMDQLVEIMAAGEVLAQEMCRAAWRPIDPPAWSALADPRPALRLVEQLLTAATAADPTIPGRVERRCQDLIERADEALGLVTDGQLLPGLCPWCGGKTETHPVGGAKTMRVRDPGAGLPVLLVCEGGRCDPPDAECGKRYRGLPAWPQYEWDWVAIKFARAATA